MICELRLSEYKIRKKWQFLFGDYICVKFDATMTAK
jgi:hypothetical protein